MRTKLFIVDDHYMVIEGIHSLLKEEKDMEWLGHATNAASCLAFLQKQLPDVILMDINLPDINGIDLCREVKQKYPAVFVLGLSTFNQFSLIDKMMDSGASGYLLKNATREELMEAIQTVLKHKTYFSHEAAQTMRRDDSLKIVLTRREKEVLELIADGMTNNEIAQKLFISVTTVETHRRNLLTKFDAKNIVSLVKTAIQLQIIQ